MPGECDPAVLSAYRDGALSEEDRRRVRAHLAGCKTCRQTVEAYAAVGASLRMAVSVPRRYAMQADLYARIARRVGHPWTYAPAAAVVASFALVGVVVLAGGGAALTGVGLMPGQPLARDARPSGESRADALAVVGGSDLMAVEGQTVRGADTPRSCAQAAPGVSNAFSQRPELLQALGCATDAPRVVGLVSQSFERGDLVRRSDTRELYVIAQDGRWRRYADPGPSVQPVSLSMRGERLELSPWFGRAWVERADLRGLLGQVVSAWRQHQGLVQVYERGVVLWDGRGVVYALAADGRSLHVTGTPAAPTDAQTAPAPLPTIETHLPAVLAAL
jgi:hypothetical protein